MRCSAAFTGAGLVSRKLASMSGAGGSASSLASRKSRREQEGHQARVWPGSSFDATETSPSPPAAMTASVSQSSPESTLKSSGRSWRICMICARSPLASLMPMTLGCSRELQGDPGLEIHRGAAGYVVEADRLGGGVGDGDEVPVEAALAGLVVVGCGGEDVVGADAGTFGGSRPRRGGCRCCVAPAITGTRPAAVSTTAATTRSPLPRRPASAPRRWSRRAPGSRFPRRSASPPVPAARESPPRPRSVNGVTSAVPHPWRRVIPFLRRACPRMCARRDCPAAIRLRPARRRRTPPGRGPHGSSEIVSCGPLIGEGVGARHGPGPHRGDRKRARCIGVASLRWSSAAVPDGASRFLA